MSEQNFRIEKDSMGQVRVPSDALYSAQTQRAVENFPISGITFPRQFIRALALIKAAAHFKAYQLPELFAGFSQQEYDVPVPYPAANHPQAWAAGAIPYMIETSLGLIPQAFEHRLRIIRPILPEFLDELEVHRLRVRDAQVDLRFERTSEGSVRVNILKLKGQLDVLVNQ